MSKALTQAPEAEKATLGSMMIELPAARAAAMHLEPVDFYEEKHRDIYSAALGILARGPRQELDVVLLAAELRERGHLDRIGGGAYLSELIESVATAAHVEYYAQIVRKASLDRQVATQLLITADNKTPENVKILGDLIFRLEGAVGSKIIDLREDIKDIVERLLAAKNEGIKTGFFELDSLFCGLDAGNGDLLTIGARPSEGKTALMTRMAVNMAFQGVEVLYLTAEMSEDQMVYRILPMATGIPYYKFRSQTLSDDERGLVVETAAEKLQLLPVKLLGKSRFSLADIRSACIRARPRVVFIDYLDRCEFPKAESRAYQIGEFLAGLRSFLMDTKIVGVLGCQLDRGVDKAPKIPPTLSDLRGSGAIENESTHVMLLWRPPPEKIDIPPGPDCIAIEGVIKKNRFGPREVATDFELNGELVRFTERGFDEKRREQHA